MNTLTSHHEITAQAFEEFSTNSCVGISASDLFEGAANVAGESLDLWTDEPIALDSFDRNVGESVNQAYLRSVSRIFENARSVAASLSRRLSIVQHTSTPGVGLNTFNLSKGAGKGLTDLHNALRTLQNSFVANHVRRASPESPAVPGAIRNIRLALEPASAEHSLPDTSWVPDSAPEAKHHFAVEASKHLLAIIVDTAIRHCRAPSSTAGQRPLGSRATVSALAFSGPFEEFRSSWLAINWS